MRLATTGQPPALSTSSATYFPPGIRSTSNGVRWLTALAPDLPVIEALPDAAEAWRLTLELTALPPRPVYGRAPDAKLPGCIVRATVKVTGPTGVEMEALTAVSVACLTIYDMIKAAERGVRIEGIHLIAKTGGKSGDYVAD